MAADEGENNGLSTRLKAHSSSDQGLRNLRMPVSTFPSKVSDRSESCTFRGNCQSGLRLEARMEDIFRQRKVGIGRHCNRRVLQGRFKGGSKVWSLAVPAHRLSRSVDYLDTWKGDEMADDETNYSWSTACLPQLMKNVAPTHNVCWSCSHSFSRLSLKDLVNHSLTPAFILMV